MPRLHCALSLWCTNVRKLFMSAVKLLYVETNKMFWLLIFIPRWFPPEKSSNLAAGGRARGGGGRVGAAA